MPTPLFTNNASATLAAGVTAAATSLTLTAGQGARFPSPSGGDWFIATLYSVTGVTESLWEIVKCTARSGDTLTVVRAQEGTTARAWSAGTPVELRITAAVATDLMTQVYTGIPSSLAAKAPLANASLTSPNISGGTISGTVTATLTSPVNIEPAGGGLLSSTDHPRHVVLKVPTVDGNLSACYIGPLLNATPAAANDFTLVIEAVSDFVAWRNIALARSGGCVLVGTQTNIRGDTGYKLQVNGKAYLSTYAQIGPMASAPVFATKKLTGTTSGNQGGTVSIAHGVTASKILSWTVVVSGATASDLYPPRYTESGYQYTTRVNSTSVVVSLVSGYSANILNKDIKVLVVYEE